MRSRALLLGILMPLALWVVLPVGSLGQAKLEELQERIQATERRIDPLRGKERVLSTQISRYNARIGELQGSISELTARVTRIQVDLDRKQALLSRIQSDLRFQRARMVRLRARLAEAKGILSRRLGELYRADRPDLMTVLLNAKGFADLIEREEFIRRVGEQDRKIIDLVVTAKADATSSAARLADLEERQRKITAEVLGQRDELADARSELVDKREGWESQRAQRASVLGNVREEREHLEGELDDLQAQEDKIRNALAVAAGNLPAGPIRAGSGSMVWPVNGTITGVFGEPRPGHYHQGLDIAAPEGTPIRAADSGTVSLIQSTASSGGYGNFTCVSHPSGLATCYAHQVRFGTSMGARVSRGQVIGYVGNTGNSFGAHLHFEVRPGGGAAVNPMNYL
jgi:murein DD-endopeptidase MepM/ murein hydrolase activator NlpD